MKKKLLLDCDGVLADCNTPVHKFAQKLLRRPLPPPETWTAWDHSEAMGLTPDESCDFHREIIGSDVAFKIKLYEGARESVYQLIEAFDVVFVTAHWRDMPGWVVARDYLLEPFRRPVIYTHHKHLIHGDYLVDDKAQTIEKGGPWKGILFRRPWNADSKHTDVVTSLDEIMRLA